MKLSDAVLKCRFHVHCGKQVHSCAVSSTLTDEQRIEAAMMGSYLRCNLSAGECFFKAFLFGLWEHRAAAAFNSKALISLC